MVKFCLAKAVECRRAAELATDPARRRSWLNTEGQWFFLARSYDNERRASGESLTISVSRGETAVLEHFQAIAPYGIAVTHDPS